MKKLSESKRYQPFDGRPEFTETGLLFPKRVIPWPDSISIEARELLISASKQVILSEEENTEEKPQNVADWRIKIQQMDEMLARLNPVPLDSELEISTEKIGDIKAYKARPKTMSRSDDRLYLYIHGGALIYGSGDFNRSVVAKNALDLDVEVIGIDYRTPPDHPYPAALDDCVSAYRHALQTRSPSQIAVGGASAGGNLAAALLLRLKQDGLPMPASLVLLSPEIDLTESGDSFETNAGLDPHLTRVPDINELYAGEHALNDPLISPLFGNVNGFCPTFIQSGTRDLFLSNAVRMHRHLRRAGIEAQLHIFESMPHCSFGGAPEDNELIGEVRKFLEFQWLKY